MHALVMSFGWLECVVVVYAFHVALEQEVGHLKQNGLSAPDHFALGMIKPGHGHATARRYTLQTG